MKLEFSRQIFEKNQISNFMKILPVGAELFHADEPTGRRRDMTNLRVAYKVRPTDSYMAWNVRNSISSMHYLSVPRLQKPTSPLQIKTDFSVKTVYIPRTI